MTPDPMAVRAVHYVLQGQCYVGRGNRLLRTVLGSCVSVTFWHSQRAVGAMCHYMLPGSSKHSPRDARFAGGALLVLTSALREHGCDPRDCQVEVYGGGCSRRPDAAPGPFEVGLRNIEQAWELLARYGIEPNAKDVGGPYYRCLEMDLAQGAIQVQRRAWSGSSPNGAGPV